MKKSVKYLGVAALATLAAAGLSSCTNDFEETNKNPNTMVVGDIDPYSLFEPLIYKSAKSVCENYTYKWNDELVQYTAFSGGTTREEHRYKISDNDWKSVWNTYATYGYNAQHLIDQAVLKKDVAAQAVGMTYKVYLLSCLTDIYGDIPYKEAFKARSENITRPKFDTTKEVYEQLLADLDSANTLYAKKPEFGKPAMDGIFGGDMTKWRRFNNSLMLRLLIHVSGRAEFGAGEMIKKIVENPSKYPIISSNDENATLKYTGIAPYRSTFAATKESDFTSSAYHLAEQMIKLTVEYNDKGLQSLIDPRLPIWGVAGSEGWKGAIAGCPPEDRNISNSGASKLNFNVLARPEAHVYYMDYAEVNFILAEAALKGYIDGGESAARSFYESGVRASIAKWAELGQYSATPVVVTSEDIENYMQSSLANWDLTTDHEQLIGNQKWLALFWTGMESYTEVRRTGYPVLTIGKGTDYNDYEYPQRFGYSNVTVSNNRDNVQEAIDRLGGENNMRKPLWWSKQAITGKLLFKRGDEQ